MSTQMDVESRVSGKAMWNGSRAGSRNGSQDASGIGSLNNVGAGSREIFGSVQCFASRIPGMMRSAIGYGRFIGLTKSIGEAIRWEITEADRDAFGEQNDGKWTLGYVDQKESRQEFGKGGGKWQRSDLAIRLKKKSWGNHAWGQESDSERDNSSSRKRNRGVTTAGIRERTIERVRITSATALSDSLYQKLLTAEKVAHRACPRSQSGWQRHPATLTHLSLGNGEVLPMRKDGIIKRQGKLQTFLPSRWQ